MYERWPPPSEKARSQSWASLTCGGDGPHRLMPGPRHGRWNEAVPDLIPGCQESSVGPLDLITRIG